VTSGGNFNALRHKFEAEGYRSIYQLTRDQMSVEDLSKWLRIGKGMADFIIQYADEDVTLHNKGELKMDFFYMNDDHSDCNNYTQWQD
jgi:hypothetical protein